ncbi:interleukin-18 receptor accessory protein-like isoform 2-T2 [Odontesthes bonariensis]|uniref:interleukin-18 receptor accessory protein-like isoform X2 n=1 Tax=Odontesthes bonariensis TaxID=219752 RepID=UPI003F588D3B
METAIGLFCFILPVFSQECCGINHQKKMTGFKQHTHRHYKAVEGEIFMIPCIKSSNNTVGLHTLIRSRTEEDKEGNNGSTFSCGKGFLTEINHSGNYTSPNGEMVFTLQVLEKISLRCFLPNESSVMLLVNIGGTISCPGLTCRNNKGAVWFKGDKAVSEQHRDSCQKEGLLQLGTVRETDSGVYFCDTQIIEQGVTWTLRRAVNVTVIPQFKASSPPDIRYPSANMTEDVELDRPHNLTCKIHFQFEIGFQEHIGSRVHWFMNHGGNMKNRTLLHMEKLEQKKELKWFLVIRKAIIENVTLQHLNHTYTCIASNTVGNTSVTIALTRKFPVVWPSLVGYPIASFVVVAGLGIIMHVKWLELRIFWRSKFQYRKQDGEEELFDVFLSCVRSHPSAEVAGGLTLSSKSEPCDYEEACLSNIPLEVLLRQVLEEHWGYRVCLLERDILPGGAYTNDVALAIKRSRMLLCVLSADYLANSDAVFVLESGVQGVCCLYSKWKALHLRMLLFPVLPSMELMEKSGTSSEQSHTTKHKMLCCKSLALNSF